MNESLSPGEPTPRRPRRFYARNATYAFLVSLAAAALFAASLLAGRGGAVEDASDPIALLLATVRIGGTFVPLLGVVAVLVAWHAADEIRRRPRLFGRRRAAIAIAVGFATILVPAAAGMALFLFSVEKDWADLVARATVPLAPVGALGLHALLARRFPEVFFFRARLDPGSRWLRDIQRGLFPHRRGTPFESAASRARARSPIAVADPGAAIR